jgi:hypothetical protein
MFRLISLFCLLCLMIRKWMIGFLSESLPLKVTLVDTCVSNDQLGEVGIQFRAKEFEARRPPLRLLSSPKAAVGCTLAKADHLIHIRVQEIEFRTQIGFHRRHPSTVSIQHAPPGDTAKKWCSLLPSAYGLWPVFKGIPRPVQEGGEPETIGAWRVAPAMGNG